MDSSALPLPTPLWQYDVAYRLTFRIAKLFSQALTQLAGEAETAFLEANFAVFSNAKNHRLAPLIPLVVPTVNLGHTQLIPAQRRHYSLTKGFLVCNSNCAVVGIVVPFAALQRFGPLDQVNVVTMQALLVQVIPVSVVSNLGSSIPLNFALFAKASVT
jgi:aspartate-semialdehyde dehydrogenase